MTTLPDPPRSSLVDPQTGRLTREWVRFFDDLRRAIVSGLDDAVGGRLDALEADSLFDGGAEAGGSAGYNDATLRNRLDDLETSMLFPDRAETEARMALIQPDIDMAMDAVFAPDHSATLRTMRNRLDALEMGQALAVDGTASLRALQNRINALELAQILIDNTTTRLQAVIRRLNHIETETLFEG